MRKHCVQFGAAADVQRLACAGTRCKLLVQSETTTHVKNMGSCSDNVQALRPLFSVHVGKTAAGTLRKHCVHFDTAAHVGKIRLSLDAAQASRPV